MESAKNRQEREIDIEERETRALENIGRALTDLVQANTVANERLSRLENGQTGMLQTLQGQTNALAVLVDRAARRVTTKKG